MVAGYCCFVGWFLAPTVFVGGWCGWSLLVDYLMDNFCVLLVGWFWLVVIVCCGWLFTGCCLLLLFGRLVNLFFLTNCLFCKLSKMVIDVHHKFIEPMLMS